MERNLNFEHELEKILKILWKKKMEFHMSQPAKNVEILVVAKKTATPQYGVPTDFSLGEAAVVQLKLTRADVKEMVRVGDDLLIKLHNGETITVRNFFIQMDGRETP